MSAITSPAAMSLVSSFGVDIAELNSTDLLVELVIDTFDQWSNPTGAFATTTICGRNF